MNQTTKLIPDSKQKSLTSFNGKVLIAEDNDANQELISYMLNDMNIEFDIAQNGKVAVDLYKKQQYKVVLMDINMPVLDGIEAFHTIRMYEKDNDLDKTPIVALTANAIKGDKEKFLSIGMDDYLSKPIDVDKLNFIFYKYLDQEENYIEVKTEQADLTEELDKLDPNKIVSKLGVSQNIANILISKFKKTIIDDLKELEKYIKEEDAKNIKDKAHYIKNSCLNIGLDDICEMLQEIESESENIDQISKIYEIIKNNIFKLV